MKVENGLYVVFEYSMVLETGERVAGTEPDQPIGFVVGRKHMLPAVEYRLLGMSAGEKATFWMMPGEAFGKYDPKNVQEVPRAAFPVGVELTEGMLFNAPGGASPYPLKIKSIQDDTVTVDMNHPLSDEKFRLDVEIHDVRPLLPDEEEAIDGGNQIPPITGPAIKA